MITSVIDSGEMVGSFALSLAQSLDTVYQIYGTIPQWRAIAII
jgi:hypothetical protein